MEFGVCVPLDDLAAFDNAGVDFLEGHVQAYLVPEEPDETFAPLRDSFAALKTPLAAANCFLPGSLRCTGPDVDVATLLQYAETAFMRAAEAGMETIVFGSGGARARPEDWSEEKANRQFLELLTALGPLAGVHRITVVIEPLNRGACNFINTVDEGADLVIACDHPNIRLLADLYHMGTDGESPDALERHAALLHHVHLADIHGRGVPRGDDAALAPYLEALRESDYDGRVSIEAADATPDAARASVDFLRNILE